MLNSSLLLRRTAAIAAAGTLVLGFAMPAQAGDTVGTNSSASQGATTNAKPVREKKYCFLFETTGTRMRSKVCKTKAEWEAQGQPIEEK